MAIRDKVIISNFPRQCCNEKGHVFSTTDIELGGGGVMNIFSVNHPITMSLIVPYTQQDTQQPVKCLGDSLR